MTVRRVHQLVAALAYGDAVSNHVLAIQSTLRAAGYESDIFAEHAQLRVADAVRPYWEYPSVSSPETVCLFHFSIGSAASPLIHSLPDRLVTIYHNITPPEYFLGYRTKVVPLVYHARRELASFVPRTALALGVSEYNRRELAAIGFARTGVLPIVPAGMRPGPPGSGVTRALYADDRTNILFVGRISPNKRIDDLLRVFAAYQRHVNRHSRLLLVGEIRGYERYYDALQKMAEALRLEEVVFTGHVDEDDLAAYYELGHLFLCLSEHEGYGVPLLEAMGASLPIVAYDAGAVAETLRGAGVLIQDKNPAFVAELMGEILRRPALRARILQTQTAVVDDYRALDPAALLLERLAPVLA